MNPAMLLHDAALVEALDSGDLKVDPYDPSRLQPSSIDLTLGDTFCVLRTHYGQVIDPKEDNSALMEMVTISDDHFFVLHPGEFVLASTREVVALANHLAARVDGKSSLGRLGVMVHCTAGFVDPGFYGEITLELSNLTNIPIKLYPGMPFAQIGVFRLTGTATRPYMGKYQGQKGPRQSRYHLNFLT